MVVIVLLVLSAVLVTVVVVIQRVAKKELNIKETKYQNFV